MTSRVVAGVLAATGAVGAAVCVGAALTASVPQVLLPVALAVVWWLAGLVALRARPEHASARLLTAVGTCHLAAFAIASVLGVTSGDSAAWLPWAAAVAANVIYWSGFAALAILLAVFPDERVRGRTSWGMVTVGVLAVVVVPVVAAVTSRQTDLALHFHRTALPAPAPLPWGSGPVDVSGVLPLLVLVGLAILVVRVRGATGERRQQLLWPLTIAAVLALMLVATPVGTHALGRGWAVVFVPVVGVLPIALLAGVRRYRLLQVELYAARTLAYGVVLALVLTIYTAAAAAAGHHGALPAVLVAAAAAVTGHPLRVWLEARVDRFVSGGRIRGHALVRHLAESLEGSDPRALATRTADTIATGMDVAWIDIRCQPDLQVHAGSARTGDARLVVPLTAAGEEIGAIECGPRRGGWSDEDIRLLTVLARHAALALRGADLASALARRVDELAASRERLVRAEDRARRQLERDLHDGIQQQLVVLLARLELLRSTLDAETTEGQIAAQSHAQAQRSLADLRNLVRGIHPPLLSDRGLVAAIEAQADQLPIPVSVDVDPRLTDARFPPAVETAAYYVVCEATTNVIKHSGAGRARVVVRPLAADGLQVAVTDDGSGFAVTATGSGLAGLRDRVEAIGGRLEISSTVGVGTTVVARFPISEMANVANA
ncbi:GAF domain-containing sensor histidine kinase [Planosporangium thailandense]|uniref:histidine kinase n=1 Tax=Planosporangium thailandense TaxID=765197 RepID=A0ABX0Y139_9ACTN|nr:GAF domain-containing sensor histidine kinase [Planosporangium thailandense]NJC71150.1 GAF domain-containing sensor histidine kinase [Planosporangium thailandense]